LKFFTPMVVASDVVDVHRLPGRQQDPDQGRD
jgi:hypothetical protein